MKYLLVYILLIGVSTSISGQVLWDGDKEDGKWSSKANWSNDELPAIGDDVIIGSDYEVLADLSTIIKSLSLEDEAILNVSNILLEISNSSSVGLEVALQCDLSIEGTIAISNSASSGLTNHGTIMITGGEIDISQSPQGILNMGGITSFGDITIQDYESHGILNQNNINNLANGTIEIEDPADSDAIGMENDISGNFTNTGSLEIRDSGKQGIINRNEFENNGILKIFNADESSLVNRGNFVNSNSLLIDSTLEYGISNYGNLTNHLMAEMMITRAQLRGLSTWSNSIFLNSGICTFEKNDKAIRNEGLIMNYNSILINNSTSNAIHNRDSIYNHSTGSINVVSSDGNGISSDGTAGFLNRGHITLDSLNTGISNLGYFSNESEIHISNVEDGISQGGDSGKFINKDSILIVNSSDIGINVNNYHSNLFNNLSSGVIQILNNEKYAIFNQGHFINSNVLSLESDNIGIRNTDTFSNWGNMEISNFSKYGIDNWPNSFISNYNTGLIHLSPFSSFDSDIVGIFNRGSILTSGTIEMQGLDSLAINNQGLLHVTAPLESASLNINGILLNQDTLIADALGTINHSGTFKNDGYAEIDGTYDLIQNHKSDGTLNSGFLSIGASGTLKIAQHFNPRTALESILASKIECFGVLEIIPFSDGGG